MISALIIEDEALAADHLEMLLDRSKFEFIIDAKISTVTKTVQWLKKNTMPDLIFMDIQLADGICFDIFSQIEISSPVIFTTAFDQYALKAFKVNSIDYLLKPINKVELNNAIEKFLKFSSAIQTPDLTLTSKRIQELIKYMKPDYKQRFIIKVGDHLKSINSSEISYFESIHKLTYVVNFQGRRYPVDYSLNELEEMIDPTHFFRVSRQHIIAVSSINDIIAFSNSRLKVQVTGRDAPVTVSRDRVSGFKKWLDK